MMIEEQKDDSGSVSLPFGKQTVVGSTVILGDCVEVMKGFADNQFDLAVVDPPYGINIADWDNEIPCEEYWKELFRASKNQIAFGGNYFNLPPTRGWVVWDKTERQHKWRKDKDCDDFEMIWTSFDQKAKMLRFTDFGNTAGFNGKLKVDYSFTGKIHPTQKHISIYEWIFKEYAKAGDFILDTHLGSGSSRIAADKAGLDFTGIEIDKEYFDLSEKRFKQYKSQLRIEGW